MDFIKADKKARVPRMPVDSTLRSEIILDLEVYVYRTTTSLKCPNSSAETEALIKHFFKLKNKPQL